MPSGMVERIHPLRGRREVAVRRSMSEGGIGAVPVSHGSSNLSVDAHQTRVCQEKRVRLYAGQE